MPDVEKGFIRLFWGVEILLVCVSPGRTLVATELDYTFSKHGGKLDP
jgi:hypothetical protein